MTIRHFNEIDFRRTWLSQLFGALSGLIDDIENRLDQDDHYDGIDAREDCESILGIAFIAAQTYIQGTVADLNTILEKSDQLDKLELLPLDVVSVVHGVTRMQLVHAIANYQKHHDEWEGWNVTDKNRRTITLLNDCGINKETEFPCYVAASLLWPESRIGELSYLLTLLEDWRGRIFRRYTPS